MKLKHSIRVLVAIILGITAIFFAAACGRHNEPSGATPTGIVMQTTPTPATNTIATPEPTPTEAPTPTPTPVFQPHSVEETKPEKYGMNTDIMVNGEIVTKYSRTDKITFEEGFKVQDIKDTLIACRRWQEMDIGPDAVGQASL